MPKRFHFSVVVGPADPPELCELLAGRSGLAKARVKEALTKGAVWLTRNRRRRQRVRRAKTRVEPGQRVELFYDEAILALEPPPARCLADHHHFSVWEKPAGLMAQGTDYGDHCSLLRQVEQYFAPRRPVYLVHRLDREAAGLMLVAHSRQAAARLSALFREQRIGKRYRAEVVGRPAPVGRGGLIELPLDSKRASTAFTVLAYDAAADRALLEVTINTGRRHQIRRHFEAIGHPLLGDPRYGRGNKNRLGLRLVAVELAFRCPLSGAELCFSLPEDRLPPFANH